MPRVRKSAGGGGTREFTVTAWQSRKRPRGNADTDADQAGNNLVVVEEALLREPGREIALPAAQSRGNQDLCSGGHSISAHAQQSSAAWRSKKIKMEPLETVPLLEEEPVVQEAAMIDVKLHEHPSPTAVAEAEMQGQGVLCVLESGAMTGHVLLPTAKGRAWRTIRVAGHPVQAAPDCYREPEWRVYCLSVLIPGEPPVEFLAECTGGDAMSLRAPVDWGEDQLIQANAATSDDVTIMTDISCTFDCEKLLAGEAAQNLVAQVQPKWSTSEATVCMGPFTIDLRKEDASAASREDHSAGEEGPSAFDSDGD